MVSLSKLSGLILTGQSVFHDTSSQQTAEEQYNIINFLGGSAPYIQRPGFGVSTEIPSGCTLEQVQLLQRHGERYPTLGDGKTYNNLYKKIKDHGTLKGDLSFFNDYTFFVNNTDNYEQETTDSNSSGNFLGADDATHLGEAFMLKYGSLYDNKSTLPIFTSNSGRVFHTSQYFAKGFLGDNYSEHTPKYVVIDEGSNLGANSLTPRTACHAYDENENKDFVSQYNTSFSGDIASRLEADNQGLNLTDDDIKNLFQWCAYEINVRGSLPVCLLFSLEEYVRYSYLTDLYNYYAHGPGNLRGPLVGSAMLNASTALLKEDSDNKIWLSFTHDFDIELYHAALGIISPKDHLQNKEVPFPNPYIHAHIVPMGARLYTEKYKCNGQSYVRHITNDAVTPVPGCSQGPGFSCALSDYESYINDRIGKLNFAKDCKLTKDQKSELTFYWDYNKVNYNASLIS